MLRTREGKRSFKIESIRFVTTRSSQIYAFRMRHFCEPTAPPPSPLCLGLSMKLGEIMQSKKTYKLEGENFVNMVHNNYKVQRTAK